MLAVPLYPARLAADDALTPADPCPADFCAKSATSVQLVPFQNSVRAPGELGFPPNFIAEV